MSSETGLEDLSMMDLFRAEVETHSEVLSAALLALERSPADPSRLHEMMRAAHSIKGAAGILGGKAVFEAALRLETIARQGDWSQAEAAWLALRHSLEQFQKALSAPSTPSTPPHPVGK